jgi:hypothetical protein
MTEQTLTLPAFRSLYNANYASLERACDDLQSVCAVVGELDPFMPDFESSVSIHLNAATLRAQATHALSAAAALASAASSFSVLAALAEASQAAVPVAAKAAASPPKTKRPKR